MKWLTEIPERFMAATITVTSSVALIAFLASYQHQYELVIHNNQTHWVGALYPLSDDLLIVAATMVLWHATSQGWGRPWGVWLVLAVGIGASAIANRADDHTGWGHIGAYISVWPAVAFLGAFESMIWVISKRKKNASGIAPSATETKDKENAATVAAPAIPDPQPNGHQARSPIIRKVDKVPGRSVK